MEQLMYKCGEQMVNQKAVERILDKIKEEIRHFMMEVNPSSSESDYACNYILGILDKYKSESEDEE